VPDAWEGMENWLQLAGIASFSLPPPAPSPNLRMSPESHHQVELQPCWGLDCNGTHF
jgi:hypothetical protein